MSIATEITKLQNNMASAYTACQTKGATLPTSQTMSNLADTILSITQGDIPKCQAIDGPKWTGEWATKGANGTIVDVVVGDEIAARNEIAVNVSKLSTTDVTINWGDGNTTTATNGWIIHTYANAGHYVITIDNQARLVMFGDGNGTSGLTSLQIIATKNTCNAVRRVQQFGSNLQSMNMIFRLCRYLNTTEGGYPANLPPIPPTITDLNYAFEGIFYNGPVPYLNHITGNVTCFNTFCSSRFSGTAQIMPPNVTTCYQMYADCPFITGIPYDIFPEQNATTLTNCYHLFQGCGRFSGATPCLWPKISHLTKAQSFDTLFGNTTLCYGPLPTLPRTTTLTSCAYMFYASSQEMEISEDYFEPLIGNVNLTNMFGSCSKLVGECPTLPNNVTGLNSLFYGCFLLGGHFPQNLKAACGTRTVSLNGTFYNCYSIKGQLPDLPDKTTDLRMTFYCCYGATGHFPPLDNLTNLTASYCTQTFQNCANVEEQPPTWFNATIAAKITTFSTMFSGCSKLKNFSHDLSGSTATTVSCQSMFASCRQLKHGPTKLPPNCNTTYLMFANCQSLSDSPIHVGAYAKLANVSGMYLECHQLKPMRNDDGGFETDKGQYYNTRITTYSSMLGYSSVDVMKQFADALLANGKSATLYGNTNPSYDWCLWYKGGSDIPV